jgi:hypothetical protein
VRQTESTVRHASFSESPVHLSRAVRRALRRRGAAALCLGAGLLAAGVATEDAAAAPFPAVIELRSLHPGAGGDGSQGFILKGIDTSDFSGTPVSDAGDVNGDQIDDLIIGATSADPGDRSRAGESYVVFGRTTGFPATFELRSLLPALGGDGGEGFILRGIDFYDYAASVSSAGDVNGDGIDDLVIGARGGDPNGQREAGETYLVFGRTTGFPAAFELGNLHPALGGDGSEGFILRGIDPDDYAGNPAGGAGDVNGDGIDDLIIGAIADPNGQRNAGESYVVFGRTTGFPATFELRSLHPAAGGDGSEGFILRGIDAFDVSGSSVDGAGDVNGDGIDDLIIGAASADPNGQSLAGESYVVFGRTGGFPAVFDLASLDPPSGGDGSEGFILEGIDPNDYSGRSVSRAGDVNGDGIDDLLIGAAYADPNGRFGAGESYVVFGRTTAFPAKFELGVLDPGSGGDGSEGFVLNGIGDNENDYSGASVSGASDVNGDGLDDLIIGAPSADPHGQSHAGESYVVFGRSTGFPPAFELGSLHPALGGDGSEGFILNGIDSLDYSGRSVSGAGDVNSDGVGDLIIGASRADPSDKSDAGESYVVFGRPPVAR